MDDLESVRTSEIIDDNMDKKCAPGVSFENGSCMKLHTIIEYANAYNKENKTKAIQMYPTYETLNPAKYKKYLLKALKTRLTKCSSQKCWTEQSFVDKLSINIREELQKYTFRAEGPEGKFEWLNTININDVMAQYEKQYTNFKFLGGVPIDFDDLPVLGIKNLDFNELIKEGKTNIGIIFNLDEHDKAGSHWVSAFSNLTEGKIYFFDSYGVRPELRIRKLMRRIAKFCQSSLGIKQPIADYNRLRHQYKGSECGVYSIMFLLNMAKGAKFEDLTTKRIPDDTVNKCRNVYFRNVDIK